MGCCGSTAKGEPAGPDAVVATRAVAQPSVAAAKPQAAAKAKNPLAFTNKPATAVGEETVKPERRIRFGIVMPESTGASSLHMFFDKEKDTPAKIITVAAKHAGFSVDKGKLVGSPEKLNLFTREGDVVRQDLEIEAHIGSTLHAGDTLILEKGNRLMDERLAQVKAAHAR